MSSTAGPATVTTWKSLVEQWHRLCQNVADRAVQQWAQYNSPAGKAHSTTTTVFWDHPAEPVPEENFWTLWCKGRLTEADTLTIRLGATPSRLTSAYLTITPYFLQAGCPSCHPTNSIKALKATSAFGLGRRC